MDFWSAKKKLMYTIYSHYKITFFPFNAVIIKNYHLGNMYKFFILSLVESKNHQVKGSIRTSLVQPLAQSKISAEITMNSLQLFHLNYRY